jgi:hypothetical protein
MAMARYGPVWQWLWLWTVAITLWMASIAIHMLQEVETALLMTHMLQTRWAMALRRPCKAMNVLDISMQGTASKAKYRTR